ncbi:MAG: thiamine pyrophosphate-dependent enzyme [Planctomycetota bacterium]
MPMVTTQRADMSFCPGCSHGIVLEQIGAALERMGLQPDQVCLVSDIGCIGIADRYFSCHTFHGLHGRSLTYAEGIKRVRPDLMVIVLIGDGGCGIGTAHLVHSARRGVGIKVLVCNNFNFGMTGGQHSPTTPPHGCTPTTPDGVVDSPFDVCQTVMVNGASHVARCSAHDRACGEVIEAALRSPGFALLDLWELCVAYYVPTNKLSPPALVELSERLGLPFGLLRSIPRTAETEPCRTVERDAAAASEASERGRSLAWRGRTEICVAGSAGQRVRSAVGVIGEILVAGGVFTAQHDDFPITVRKGHSISNLIVSDAPIRYTGMDAPDVVVVLSEDGLRRLSGVSALKPSALVVAERSLVLPPVSAEVRRFDLRAIGKVADKASAALVIVTAALVHGEWIEPHTLLAAAEQCLSGRYAQENLRAIEAGCRLQLSIDATSPVTVLTKGESNP